MLWGGGASLPPTECDPAVKDEHLTRAAVCSPVVPLTSRRIDRRKRLLFINNVDHLVQSTIIRNQNIEGMWRFLFLFLVVTADDNSDKDGENSRKVLGSSVVTSVSVIMDAGNGSKIYADAAGKPVSKPQTASDLASPINLLTPDRYEFYTFNDAGDLVKRLMTLEEIQDIIATGDGDGFSIDSFTSNGFIPEKRVNDVVNNVQNVLKEEMKSHKNTLDKTQLDTPDVTNSWSTILATVFGNSGDDIKPEPSLTRVTPDTIIVEPTTTQQVMVTSTTEQISTTEKLMTLQTKQTTTKTTTTTEKTPTINVEIITNSNSTQEKNNHVADNSQVVEIKPNPIFELTKENTRPIFHVPNRKSTKKPSSIKVTTFRPTRTTVTRRRTTTSTTPKTTKETTSTTTEIPKTTSPAIQDVTKLSTAVADTSAQASSVLIEKVAPPQISTTTQVPSTPSVTSSNEQVSTISYSSTNEVPTDNTQTTVINSSNSPSKEILTTFLTTVPVEVTEPTQNVPTTTTEAPFSTTEEPLPSLLTVLSNYQILKEQNEKKESETTTTPSDVTSTFNSLSTFFYVADESVPNMKTTNGESMQNIDTTVQTNDLSGLNTEYITVKTINVNGTTSEPQSTDKTTSELLEQFLLTSTNIYEINAELSERVGQTTASNENAESVTAEEDKTTERFLIKLNDPTETPSTTTTTTDQTFVETIEQLISQAVGTPSPPVLAEKEAMEVQALIMQSANKTMPQIMMETATAASNLVGINDDVATSTTEAPISTTLVPTTTSLPLTTTTVPVTTTITTSKPTTTTASPTTMTTTPVDIITTTTQLPTTSTLETETLTTTEQINRNDVLLSDSVSSILSQVYGEGSTTVEYDSTTITTTSEPTTTTIKENHIPHIINITIITNEKRKNQTKPAKSDLSLEMDYEDMLTEIKKNSTLMSLLSNSNINSSQEILKTEATSSIQNQNHEDSVSDQSNVETNSVTESTTEEVTTTTMEPTTTQKIEISTLISKKPSIVITINEKNNNKTDSDESMWTLVSTIAPHADTKVDAVTDSEPPHHIGTIVEPPTSIDLVPKPLQGFGLEDSTAKLDSDIYQFVQLCNELAFGFWKSVTTGLSSARSLMVSPFAATSLLAMVFLGARGATSGEMNEILKLDDMVTFNPHLIFKNVSESIEVNPDSGVAISAIIRELYSDRSRGKLLGFYKERVRQFYDGHVEEASFREIGDVIRRRTNLLVKKNTEGKISEFLKDSSIFPKPPLAGISISIFQTDCSQGSSEGRDGELHFVVLPSIRQRRLIPIPATVYRTGFLAGYEPSLDATAAALGTKDQTISTILIIPGQQGSAAPGDGLARLEKRLIESSFKKGAWARLLRSLIPRPGLELQIPRFLHRSLINATQSLKRMGLHDLFDSRKADLKGLNGAAHELHLSDVLQINEFGTCGEKRIAELHHKEVYPATAERKSKLLERDLEEPRDYQRAFHDPLHDPSYLSLPLPLRPRQARLPEAPRLRFDRPFLYFVRHNPTGLILHMGRFHPRLLP